MSTTPLTDKFKVQRQMCSTCIYRKKSPLDLKKLEADVADKHMKGFFRGFRACHHAAGKSVCCAGFWARHRDSFPAGQIAQRLNCVSYVKEDSLNAPPLSRRNAVIRRLLSYYAPGTYLLILKQLREIEKERGVETHNATIRKFDLTAKYGIQPIGEENVSQTPQTAGQHRGR